MTDTFVIRNQLGHYWGKRKTWVDGSDARAVMRTAQRDDATNTLFELSSKDFELRGEILSVELDQRSEPIVETSQHPLPIDPEADAQDSPNQEQEQEQEQKQKQQAEETVVTGEPRGADNVEDGEDYTPKEPVGS